MVVDICAVNAAWLNASQRSRVGVGMNTAAGGGGGEAVLRAEYPAIQKHIMFTISC